MRKSVSRKFWEAGNNFLEIARILNSKKMNFWKKIILYTIYQAVGFVIIIYEFSFSRGAESILDKINVDNWFFFGLFLMGYAIIGILLTSNKKFKLIIPELSSTQKAILNISTFLQWIVVLIYMCSSMVAWKLI